MATRMILSSMWNGIIWYDNPEWYAKAFHKNLDVSVKMKIFFTNRHLFDFRNLKSRIYIALRLNSLGIYSYYSLPQICFEILIFFIWNPEFTSVCFQFP